MEFGSELGLHRATVEGDSVLVVKALKCKDNGLAPYGHLINDVSLFSGSFSELSYSHIRRDGNKVAHSLARLALTSDNTKLYCVDGGCSISHFNFCSDRFGRSLIPFNKSLPSQKKKKKKLAFSGSGIPNFTL